MTPELRELAHPTCRYCRDEIKEIECSSDNGLWRHAICDDIINNGPHTRNFLQYARDYRG